MIKNLKSFVKKCSAWSGSNCTRNPYTEGCLKENKKSKVGKIAYGADNVGIIGDRLITNKDGKVTISKDPVKVSGFIDNE